MTHPGANLHVRLPKAVATVVDIRRLRDLLSACLTVYERTGEMRVSFEFELVDQPFIDRDFEAERGAHAATWIGSAEAPTGDPLPAAEMRPTDPEPIDAPILPQRRMSGYVYDVWIRKIEERMEALGLSRNTLAGILDHRGLEAKEATILRWLVRNPENRGGMPVSALQLIADVLEVEPAALRIAPGTNVAQADAGSEESSTAPEPPGTRVDCPDCDHVADDERALKLHRWSKHDAKSGGDGFEDDDMADGTGVEELFRKKRRVV